MTADTHRTPWQTTVWHAPGVVIGLYFLSLQSVATINFSYLLLLAGALLLLLAQPALRWRALLETPSLLAGALVASTALSAHMAAAANVKSGIEISLIPGVLVYLIVALCVRDPRQLAAVAASFFIALCATTWIFWSASLHSEFSRTVQLIYHARHPLFLAANDVLMYVVFMPLVIWFARLWPGRAGALLAIGYVLLLALLSTLLLSRLPLLIVAAYGLVYFGAGRGRRFWYGALLAVGVAIVAALLLDASFAKKLHTLDLARLRTWIAALAMFLDAPSVGNGPGSFSALYPAYYRDMPESIRFGAEVRNIGWAHSLFFESAAEKGLLGLAAIVAYFVYLWQALRRRTDAEGFARALRACAVICLVASIFELSLLRVWGVYAIFLLLALVAIHRAADEREKLLD
jgi:O-antigen ligase